MQGRGGTLRNIQKHCKTPPGRDSLAFTFLMSEQDSSCSPPVNIHVAWAVCKGSSRAATLDHDDDSPLTVLLSVLALSLMERTPESMGEETVESIPEGGAASGGPES